MLFQIACIDHDHQRIRRRLEPAHAGDDVARHPLVGGGGVEAVRAGQIDQLDQPPVAQRGAAGMSLHRHAGVIADLLPRAGQRIEQRALARIGIADQRHQRRGGRGRDLSPPLPFVLNSH